jgi:hypothetical protein
MMFDPAEGPESETRPRGAMEPRHAIDAPERAPLPLLAALAILAATAGSAALARYCFPFFAFDPDSAAYLFEAKLMAKGMLAATAPPDFGFSPSPHINIQSGLWYAKYPFGTSLFLVPGILAGAPWLMPVLATGLTLFLFHAVVRELTDGRTAAVALVLAGLSPTTLLIGGSLLSQVPSKLSLAVFLFALLQMTKDAGALSRGAWGAAAGLTLGYAFNTRPLVAVVFGVAGAGLLVYRLGRSSGWRASAGAVATAAIAGAVMLGLFLAWNAHFTGDPLRFTYHALQQGDRMGFGLRGEGYAPFIRDFRTDFTPADALVRIVRHTLPCVLFNAVGWGWYEPAMFLPSDPHHSFPLLAVVLILPLGLAILPFRRGTRTAADLFFGAVVALTFAALFFQYSDHSNWGATPLNCSYYNEATLFGLIPLVARGAVMAKDEAKRRLGRRATAVLGIAGALLLANTLVTDRTLARQFRHWDPYYQTLPRLVGEAGLHDAVVFLPRSRNAPVGNYPFVPLAEADIVYFRLGPLPQWGLEAADWRAPYREYFTGRAAYIFDGKALTKIDPAAAE